MQIRKAQRRKARLRLGIAAPSGAGKTYGALQLAFGLGGKVGMIDTEHGSGDLYAHLGDYDIIPLEAPYTVAKYREALAAFEQAKYDTVIIDSLSHAWAGEGGLLDKHGKLVDGGKARDSFGAWRQITPEHNALVESLLASPCHIIATMRSKTEYVLEAVERNGRTIQMPRKVGMAPVMRDGVEYEFTVMLDISDTHSATATKDRTGILDGQVLKLDKSVGQKLKAWLEQGEEALPQQASPTVAAPLDPVAAVKTRIEAISDTDAIKALGKEALAAAKADGDTAAYKAITAVVVARLDKLKEAA